MTNSDDLPKVFATLSFAGDQLDPSHISKVLHMKPHRAHRVGEIFYAGKNAGELKGRTGIWYFDTRGLPSTNAEDHFGWLLKILYPKAGDPVLVDALRAILGREHAKASISLFWYGAHGATPPPIPAGILAAAGRLGATIETDFDTD